ncbi:pilin [Spongiactinospora sp. TRM90649]|uniref:pilin n=1 Tax=Spongiactinospora sp. TRM90649 TaxID=3031114 RepID=UPI0023F994D2|nr:pilin [Spongiactinospora sp. TRM90649]MDF5758802.1 pilin [Spongiactinospora sp. TRM90649]
MSSRLKLALIAMIVVAAIGLGTLLEVGIARSATTLAVPATLNQVVDNLRKVIVGLLVALATLFLTVGGVRYILAGGDPGEVEAAKKTLRYAALGYGIAALAPLLVNILKSIVGA